MATRKPSKAPSRKSIIDAQKRAAARKGTGKTASTKKKSGNWFERMTPTAQRAYIQKHPNSIYAKGVKAGKKAAAAKAPRKSAGQVARQDSPEALKITKEIEEAKQKIKSERERSKHNTGSAPYMMRNRMLSSKTIGYHQDEIKKLTKKRAEQRKADRKKK